MLTLNPKDKSFVLYTHDKNEAERVGLTLSKTARGQNGEHVFYTADYNKKPQFNGYAALSFWDQADAKAREALGSLKKDYDRSMAKATPSNFPCPDGLEFMMFQRAGIEYALTKGNTLIGDDMGLGKEQPVDMPVLTPTGWRKIGDLVVGDPLIGRDGGTYHVTGVFPQGVKPAYRVTFRDRTSTECGLDHLWMVRNKNRITRGGQWAVKSLRQIIEKGVLDSNGLSRWRIPLFKPHTPPMKSLPLDVCYEWLGSENGYASGKEMVRVKYIGEKEQVCIAVSAPDHLYVTSDFIVTHNTMQAIGIANEMKAKRVLVICPATIRLGWQRAIKEWSTLGNVSTYPILQSKNGVSPFANYTMVSYDLTRNDGIHEALCDGLWDLVILDEAHYLKEMDAKRTQAIFGTSRGKYSESSIAQRAGHIVALTGTPLINRPRECYTMARALCWESIDWMSFDSFCYRFNPAGVMNSGFTVEKKGRLPELQARLRCNFMIRRMKSEVLTELPDSRFELTYVEPNGAIQSALAKERLINFTLDDLKNPFTEIWGQISTVRREMGEAKVPRVVEHMKYLLDIEEIPKIVMFAHHRSVMDRLMESLQGYGMVQLRGGMSTPAKDQAVQSFIHDPKVRVFQGQLEAAGFGVDGLQRVCSRVVFAEPSWTPSGNQQAMDRCHRIGQHDNVLGQFLVVEGSLDERVLATVLDKAHTIHDSLDRRLIA